MVRANRTPFSGEIKFNDLMGVGKMHFGVDDAFKDSDMKSQGTLVGNYVFKEDSTKKSSGTFCGTMKVCWFIAKDDSFHYDDIESSYSDNFKNNQYEGTWTLYGSKKSKVANWGEYRIPNSGDLDIGAGEFGPDPKYKNQGWDDYAY